MHKKAWIDRYWYNLHPLCWLLWPLSLVYQSLAALRRFYLSRFRQQPCSVPVIVVGNLTVGGVGKTPLVIALAKELKQRGLRVGIVSRGYGARFVKFPFEVSKDARAIEVGDEPLLLAQKTDCPVVIAPKRIEAVRYLLKKYQSQVVISDDGLQHYAMGRAIEIVVIDGARGLGNGFCLPAGPLREAISRLKQADFVVINGNLQRPLSFKSSYRMDLIPGEFMQVKNNSIVAKEKLKPTVAAVAGIGNPERFFTTLSSLGIQFNPYSYPDHHSFRLEELDVDEKIVVMTEKDAVKCRPFATDRMYFLPVEATVEDKFWHAFWLHKQLQGIYK
jgi:tetraacyldisaccharide 4'-kinase